MSFQYKIEPSIVEDPNLIKDKGPSTFVRFLNFEKFFIIDKEHFFGLLHGSEYTWKLHLKDLYYHKNALCIRFSTTAMWPHHMGVLLDNIHNLLLNQSSSTMCYCIEQTTPFHPTTPSPKSYSGFLIDLASMNQGMELAYLFCTRFLAHMMFTKL
jgi:hypothetical protein